MGELVLEESLGYLKEAQDYLNTWKELDSFQEIFEADNPEVQAQQDTNNKAASGAGSSLKKAISAIKKIIKNIIDAISNFFKEITATDEERKAFDAFKEKCKNDPSLKNKKITITDYRKFNDEYDRIIAEAEELDRELAKGKDSDITKITNKMKSAITGAAGGFATAVAIDAARNMARSNRDTAKLITRALSSDTEILDSIEKNLDVATAKKFKKDIECCGKRISLRRAIINFRRTKCDCAMDALKETINSVKDLASIGGATKSAVSSRGILHSALKNDEIRGIAGTAAGVATGTAKITASAGIEAHKMIKDENKEANKQAKRQAKLDKRNKKGDFSQDSASSFLTGSGKRKFVKNDRSDMEKTMDIMKQIEKSSNKKYTKSY